MFGAQEDNTEWELGPVMMGISGLLLVILIGEIVVARNITEPLTLEGWAKFLGTVGVTGAAMAKSAAVGFAAA